LRHLSSFLSYLVLVVVLVCPYFTRLPLSHRSRSLFASRLPFRLVPSHLWRLPHHRACHRLIVTLFPLANRSRLRSF
jgi:uncharacterized membrane protein YcfT